MKRLILIVLIFNPLFIFAQTDSTSNWTKGGSLGININQATLVNWAAGGFSSFSGGAYYNQIIDYKKDGLIWNNSLELGLGFIREGDQDRKKADDKIVLVSAVGKRFKENSKWYYAGMVDFRTQFVPGYDDSDFNNLVSEFMAPGYLLATIGIDYKPNEFFNVGFGPVSSKFTFVLQDSLADAGNFGVKGAQLDGNGDMIKGTGENMRGEFGATLVASFNKEIIKNVNFNSKLILFTNYLENPEKIDVNWENTFNLKVNDFLSAMIYIQTIYDYDVKFENIDDLGNVTLEDRWQFKSIISLGVAYTYGGTRG
ncbi:MAG: DUF3078 domain-containing protein [Reichenbachiella sp.]